jgi:hypothetical protein
VRGDYVLTINRNVIQKNTDWYDEWYNKETTLKSCKTYAVPTMEK